MENDNILAPFEGRDIRKVWHDEQWYFSIFDVIAVLTDTTNPKRYWNDLKRRDSELDREGGTQISYPLKMQTAGGKQNVLCAHTEGVFRLVMSVPSPKAESFKLWLAQIGRQHIEEIENPELLTERQAEIYRAKGYPEEWVQRRIQSIETRKALTEEWKRRGVKEGQEYSILTATIAKGTFGITPSEHSALKGLERENLRDHMTPLELIFTALGEEVTRRVIIKDDAKGFSENQDAAVDGGRMANASMQRLESELGEKVVSADNFLGLGIEKDKKGSLPEAEKPKE